MFSSIPRELPPEKHTRLILDLDDGSRIFFDDARKFGYVRVLSPDSLATWPFWNRLGPEPLDVDAEAFAACFRGRRGAIKSLLLDQTVIAGCGNIYADESLFRAGIRPDAQNLSKGRLIRLHDALQEVLLESIAACGSSIRDYRTARGDAGAFQNNFRVVRPFRQNLHDLQGTPLENCRIAGRTTVFLVRIVSMADLRDSTFNVHKDFGRRRPSASLPGDGTAPKSWLKP